MGFMQPPARPAFVGLGVISTPAARENIGFACPLPKRSRHRSMRTRKKLGKRGIFMSWEPTAYEWNGTLYAHPIIVARIEALTRRA